MQAALPPIPPGARHVCVAPERLSRWLDGFADRHGAITVDATQRRVHLAAPDGAQSWIDVAFPPLIRDTAGILTSLCLHSARARTVGVVLVRRGGYAAGVFAGVELLESKVGSSYVQATTKAGGWSQQRYARRRANQSRAAFADAADVAARIVLPRIRELAAVVGGGDRAALEAVLRDGRLEPLRALLAPRFLPVPDPRLRVLQQTPALFRAVDIHLWP